MAGVDLVIVVVFFLVLVGLAGWLASRQRNTADYYLGGRHLPAWSLGLSLAANQISAISLVGAPAFVALREGGGLVWLQYELAVPLAMAGLILWGVPVLRRARGADVYAAVEERLGMGARRVLAAFFLLGRGLGAGVIVYTSSLVVDAVTGWGLGTSLAVMGAVAVAYTTLGGLVADVFSDVLQLALLWGGTLVATVVLWLRLSGGPGVLARVDPERLIPLDLASHGLGDGATFAFWPMLFGGLFLYLSYYGCDQTQAQRILAAPTPDAARRALCLAALVRLPLVMSYCLFGVLLAAFVASDGGFARALAGQPPDALVPQFLVTYVPVGLLGVAVAGILAAALSSLDSALNSLSAVTLEEFLPRLGAGAGRWPLVGARAMTVAWGAWATLTGLWFSGAGETVIEIINRVGSLFYGPILALFVLAWRGRRADGRSAVGGAVAGVALNLTLWGVAPGVSWLWWNATGFLATWAVGEMAGRSSPRATRGAGAGDPRARTVMTAETQAIPGPAPAADARVPRMLAGVLIAEFLVILLGLGALTMVLG